MSAVDLNAGMVVVDITTRPAKMNIRTYRPKMKLVHTPGRMQIDRKMPTFHVNWSQVHTESHNAPALTQVRQYADNAQVSAMQATGDIARRGDMLMHIESGDAITAISQEATAIEAPEINISSMPQSEPLIDWEEGIFRINWQEHELSIEWENIQKPEIYVEPHSVEVRLQNLPGIKIKLNNKVVKEYIGNKLDKKI